MTAGTPKKETRLVRLDSDGMADARRKATVRALHGEVVGAPGDHRRILSALALARMTDDGPEVRETRAFLQARGLAGAGVTETVTGFFDQRGKPLDGTALARAAAASGDTDTLRDLLKRTDIPAARIIAAEELKDPAALEEIARTSKWAKAAAAVRAALARLDQEAPTLERRGGAGEEVEERILGTIRDAGGGLTRPEIAKTVGGNASRLASAFRALVDSGRIARTGAGKNRAPFFYSLPNAPPAGEAR